MIRQQMTPRTRKHLLATLILCSVLVGALLATPVIRAQSAPPITYERYDSEITVNPDGTFLVREVQQIRFDDVFESAFAEIPGELINSVSDIQVYEDGEPYLAGSGAANTFSIEREGDVTYVDWSFTPTTAGDVRTFVLEYLVEGGLWVYPDEQILEWRAVPADRSGIVVEESVVTVNLPDTAAVELLQYTAYGPEFTTEAQDGLVIFSATEPIADGVQFQVQVGMPPTTTVAERQRWQEQEDSARLDYRFGSIDAELTLDDDGTLWVEERHQLNVSEGSIDNGFRTIPTTYLDQISEIEIREGDQEFTETNSACDYCFQLSTTPRRADWVIYDLATDEVTVNEQRGGQISIDWQFPPLVRGETTTFTLRYRVDGAIQQLEDHQQLNWVAVFSDRDVEVTNASLQLHLPATLSAADVEVAGGDVTLRDDNVIRMVAPTTVDPGRPWVVSFTFPVDALAITMPEWQQAMVAAIEEAQSAATRRARTQLGLGVLSLLLGLLGPLGVYLLWYTRGRDLPIPTVADYLTEPPSELPPAIVAYLLEERPTTKGALASLFHLATMGLFSIRFDGAVAIKRLWDEDLVAGEALVTPEGYSVQVPKHLATLFNTLKPHLPWQTEVTLTDLSREFRRVLPTVYAEMGEEATHFFDELPQTVRHRWLVRGQWIVIGAFAIAFLLGLRYLGELGWIALLPAVALIFTGALLILVSRWMPRRTNRGVEEAERWRAFRTYLRNLKNYAGVDDAQQILDRYFAYAVAFEVEKVVLRQAEELGGHLPPWSHTPTWDPMRRPYRRGYPQRYPQAGGTPTVIPSSLPDLMPGGGGANPPGERPSLSGMSRKLGNALSNASTNLGSLLTQAVGPDEIDTPFESLWAGTESASKTGGKVAATTLKVLGEILAESSSGGGSGGYGSSGSSRGSWSSSRSRSSSRGSFSSSRGSSSRRSGGGGRRGFR